MDWREYLAGAIGGVAGLIVGHPFDTIKVIKQNARFAIPTTQIIQTVQSQGMKSYFRGLSLPLWSYGVVNSVFFGTYKSTINLIAPEGNPSMHLVAISAAMGGILQTIPSVPVELIKTRLQKDAARKIREFRGPLDCIRQILRQEGFRGLYRGTTAQLPRDVIASTLYFLTYEYCLTQFHTTHQLPFLVSCFAGGALAGVISWTSILPLDVWKTRIQAVEIHNKNLVNSDIREAWKSLIQDRAFARGYGLIVIRAFFVNAITLTAYELTIREMKVN